MLRENEAVLADGRDYLVTRSHQIGFDQVVIFPLACGRIRIIGTCWPSGAKGCNAVIVSRIRSECVGRTDGDDRRIVSRRMDSTVHLLSGGIFAVVAGSGDNHNAGIDELACGPAEWIIPPCFDGRRADA